MNRKFGTINYKYDEWQWDIWYDTKDCEPTTISVSEENREVLKDAVAGLGKGILGIFGFLLLLGLAL